MNTTADKPNKNKLLEKLLKPATERRVVISAGIAFASIIAVMLISSLVPTLLIQADFIFHALYFELLAETTKIFHAFPIFIFPIDGGMPVASVLNNTPYSIQYLLSLVVGGRPAVGLAGIFWFLIGTIYSILIFRAIPQKRWALLFIALGSFSLSSIAHMAIGHLPQFVWYAFWPIAYFLWFEKTKSAFVGAFVFCAIAQLSGFAYSSLLLAGIPLLPIVVHALNRKRSTIQFKFLIACFLLSSVQLFILILKYKMYQASVESLELSRSAVFADRSLSLVDFFKMMLDPFQAFVKNSWYHDSLRACGNNGENAGLQIIFFFCFFALLPRKKAIATSVVFLAANFFIFSPGSSGAIQMLELLGLENLICLGRWRPVIYWLFLIYLVKVGNFSTTLNARYVNAVAILAFLSVAITALGSIRHINMDSHQEPNLTSQGQLAVETSTGKKIAWSFVAPPTIRSGLDEFALDGLEGRIFGGVPLTSYIKVNSWEKGPDNIFVKLKVVGPSNVIALCDNDLPFIGSWIASPETLNGHSKTKQTICAYELKDYGQNVHFSMVWACVVLHLLLLPMLYNRMKQLMN